MAENDDKCPKCKWSYCTCWLDKIKWTPELIERAKKELPKVIENDPRDAAFRKIPVTHKDLNELVD